jgi:hypothetical protein
LLSRLGDPVIPGVFMVRSFAVTAVLSCLAAPAWAQAQPTTETAATHAATSANPTIRKLAPKARTDARHAGRAEIGHCQFGVIPIAGNLFTIEKIGPIALSNTYTRAAVDGWGFDDLIVSRVRAAAPGAAVRRIAFSKKELAGARTSRPLFRNINSELKDFARQVSAGTNCDRYVVVHRSAGPSVFGIGIVKFVSLIESRTYLFALMHVRVYDGHTFDLIKEGPALIKDESRLARAYLNPLGGPYRALDERSFPTSRAEAVANPTLREGVRALLTASLDEILPAMLRQ